jgi:hypothetical protein
MQRKLCVHHRNGAQGGYEDQKLQQRNLGRVRRKCLWEDPLSSSITWCSATSSSEVMNSKRRVAPGSSAGGRLYPTEACSSLNA